MKLQRDARIVATATFCLLILAGCSNSKSPQAINELHVSLDEVTDLTISYDEEKISFFNSANDELVIKEYMTEKKRRFCANVEQRNHSIHISEGGKPLFKGGFSRYVEVYLPATYDQNLTITTTDGTIDLSDISLNLSALRIDSTDGTIRLNDVDASTIHLSTTRGSIDLGSVEADQIRLETTSGDLTCEKLQGQVAYTSTSGDADIKAAIGSGSYKANNSGKLSVTYKKVTGDLSLFNKNDNIALTLPENLSFEFWATTKNGSISTTFQEEGISIDGRTASGTVGINPTAAIEVETKNGNIQVTQ